MKWGKAVKKLKNESQSQLIKLLIFTIFDLTCRYSLHCSLVYLHFLL